MSPSHVAALCAMLERLDARLLELPTLPHPLGDETLREVATLESARGAAHRLLGAAGQETGP